MPADSNTRFASTVEDEILVDPVDAPEILDDFEIGEEDILYIQDREVNKQKIRRRVEQYKVGEIACRYLTCQFCGIKLILSSGRYHC